MYLDRKVAAALNIGIGYLMGIEGFTADTPGEVLRLARKRRGLSQLEMAAEFGID